jgi:uncharacterized protein YkwD
MKFLVSGAVVALLVVTLPNAGLGQTQVERPDLEEVAQRIVRQTNRFRRQQEVAPLPISDQLRETAQYFADYMADTDEYGHEADGQTAAERAENHGYDYCLILENIAYQYHSSGFTARELSTDFTQSWEHSPGHRKNMLDPDVVETGVAVAHSQHSDRYYAVQMFGRPKSLQIAFEITNHSPDDIEYELDGSEFSLSPRFSRTHYVCRPLELTLILPSDAGKQRESFIPGSGDQFVIRQKSGELIINRKKMSPTPEQ